MKHYAIVAIACLTACAAALAQQQSRPTSRDDPTRSCFSQAENNSPTLDVLKPKLGNLFGRAVPTIEMRANRDKPTDEEKQALSTWAQIRQQCLEMGRAFRAQYSPPGWAVAFDESQSQFLAAIANLYVGDISYGQFVAERERLAIAGSAKLEQADRSNMAAMAQQQAQQRAMEQQQNQARTNAAIQLLLQPQPRPAQPMFSPSVNCTSRAVGNTVQTNCN